MNHFLSVLIMKSFYNRNLIGSLGNQAKTDGRKWEFERKLKTFIKLLHSLIESALRRCKSMHNSIVNKHGGHDLDLLWIFRLYLYKVEAQLGWT